MQKECPICYELRNSVFLSCGHGFCYDCIEEWSKTKETTILHVSCPICRNNDPPPSIPSQPEYTSEYDYDSENEDEDDSQNEDDEEIDYPEEPNSDHEESDLDYGIYDMCYDSEPDSVS
jgi:hypothetical protein